MMNSQVFLIAAISLLNCLPPQVETILHPNCSLKSHETLNINKIEFNATSTVFYMSIENRIEGGTFCADKNIYLLYPDGKKSKLISSSGIPVCPDTYNFRMPGEKLEFTLTFPPVKNGADWVDLIEDCNDNCFSFYGILLDNSLNNSIDEAFQLAENKESGIALDRFVKMTEEIDKDNSGIEGLLYINIIKLAISTGDDKKAGEWYKKFRLSNAPRLPVYLKFLNDQGIKY